MSTQQFLPQRNYILEEPEVYVERYRIIDEASLPFLVDAVEKSGKEAHRTALLGKQAGLGIDAYVKAMRWVGRADRLAYNDLKNAAGWLYSPAIFELDRLLTSSNAEELFMSDEDFEREALYWRDLAEKAAWADIESALLTGTRPVLWQALPGRPCMHNPRYGMGSLFVVMYKGKHFAITAKHVVDGVDPAIFRLMLAETKDFLPVHAGRHPLEGSQDYQDDPEDIFVWQIDEANTAPGIEWWSWNLEGLYREVSDIGHGQRVYAVGYPGFEENFDTANFDFEEHPFVASGLLTDRPLTDDVYSMRLDQDLPSVTLNGMSGGPVFARFDEKFHFVGMCIRGGGTPPHLHLISSGHVLGFLDTLIEESSDVGF